MEHKNLLETIFPGVEPLKVPPYWLPSFASSQVQAAQSDVDTSTYEGRLYQCPLTLKLPDESEGWRLPIDPVITVKGKHRLVRRNVLKQNASAPRRGSVKELWAQEDYSISIAGILRSADDDALPESDLWTLRKYVEARELITVENDLLLIFGITRMVIESFDLPHTPGAANQQYNITAYSDDDFELLVEN